jgi:hypothetical protein
MQAGDRASRAARGSGRRVRQFFRATFARVHPGEIAALQTLLTPAQVALFERMDRSDQRHSLDVMDTLRQAGHDDKELLQAALLHDAAKSAPDRGPLQRLTVWHRTAVVLMLKGAPRWLARLAADGRGWKRPFAIHVRHAQSSAELAAQAGCTPAVVALIRAHHQPEPNDRRTVLLQWADEQN